MARRGLIRTRESRPAQPKVAPGASADDVAGVVQSWLGALADAGLASEVAAELDRLKTTRANALAWLGGQKMLVQVRVGRSRSLVAGDPELVHTLRLVAVDALGVGGTPIDAMVSFLGQDHILPGEAPGVVEDRSMRKLVWIDEHGGMQNVVDPDAVSRSALAIRADQLLSQQNERRIADERWLALDRAAAVGIMDLEIRQIAHTMIRAARDAAARVADIDRRLQEALDRERRAAAAMSWLTDLGKALSLAEGIAGLKARLGADAPPAPLELKDSGDLVEYTRELVTVTRDGVAVLQSEKTIETRVYDGNRNRFEQLRQQQDGGQGPDPLPGATPGRLP